MRPHAHPVILTGTRRGRRNYSASERILRKQLVGVRRKAKHLERLLGIGPPAGPSVAEAHYKNEGLSPFSGHAISEADRARLALRETARRMSTSHGVPTLVTLPGVQGLSHAIRYIDGGRDRFVEAVQLAVLNNEPVAVRWWAVYAELPPYPRSIISFDDVCAASGVMPAELVPVVVSTAMTLGMDVGNLVAAFMHPKVIAAHVTSAARIDGDYADLSQRDRFAFLQARGMAPLPRNTVINVHANASANARAASAASAEPSVPSFTADMDALRSARTGVQQALASGTSDLDLFQQVEMVGVVDPGVTFAVGEDDGPADGD